MNPCRARCDAGIATGVLATARLDVPDPIAKVADVAGLGWIVSIIKRGAIALSS
ncbi:MAG: hypothetical protein ABI637_08175 [Gemmatimonadota bacterium]